MHGLSRRIGGAVPTDDRLSDAPESFDVVELEKGLVQLNRTMIRKKQIGSPSGERFAALDGTPLAISRLPGKSTTKGPRQWRHWRRCDSKDPKKGYVLKAVDAVLMDPRNPLILGYAFEGPEYGELSAARELLQRLHRNYGRLLDGVVGDALYGCGPFIRHCHALGYRFLFRIKPGSMPTLVVEGDRAIGKRPPDYVGPSGRLRDKKSLYRIWETTIAWDFDGIVLEVRFLRIEKDGVDPTDDEWPRYLISDIAINTKDTLGLSNFYAWRYDDTEIQAHRQLWQEYGQHHLVSHDPTAVMARLLVVAMFRNMFEVYFERVVCAHDPAIFLRTMLGPRFKESSLAARRALARSLLHKAMEAMILCQTAPGWKAFILDDL